jgi:hypothetical protein
MRDFALFPISRIRGVVHVIRNPKALSRSSMAIMWMSCGYMRRRMEARGAKVRRNVRCPGFFDALARWSSTKMKNTYEDGWPWAMVAVDVDGDPLG